MKKNYRLKKVDVDENNPYNNDLLGRKKQGDTLFELVQHYGGFVMAINGKWGSGKTTFVEMWKQQMENEHYKTFYYNAWENDYISDPLVGIISEFNNQIDVPGREEIIKFTDFARKVALKAIPALTVSAIKTFTGFDTDIFKDSFKDASKEALDILNERIDDYIEQKKSIKEFRRVLTEYVQKISPDKPIIIILDDLDRCKPDFAVKTLERIKHLFSVENVVFVLAIDREQLCHSIRGYYGSELINADDYLRRFIDIQYDLPIGTSDDVDLLVASVMDQFEYTTSTLATHGNDLIGFQAFVESMYRSQNMSIRQLEKWMIQTRLFVNQAYVFNIHPVTLSFIIYIRDFDKDFYNRLMNLDMSDQDILNRITKYFTHSSFDKGVLQGNVSLIIIAQILKMKYVKNDISFQKNVFDTNGNIMLTFDANIDRSVFIKVFNHANQTVILPIYFIQQLLS